MKRRSSTINKKNQDVLISDSKFGSTEEKLDNKTSVSRPAIKRELMATKKKETITPKRTRAKIESEVTTAKKRKAGDSIASTPTLQGTPALGVSANFDSSNPFQSASKSAKKKVKRESTKSVTKKTKRSAMAKGNLIKARKSKQSTASPTVLQEKDRSDKSLQELSTPTQTKPTDEKAILSKPENDLQPTKLSDYAQLESKTLPPTQNQAAAYGTPKLYDNTINPNRLQIGSIYTTEDSVIQKNSLNLAADLPSIVEPRLVQANSDSYSSIRETPKRVVRGSFSSDHDNPIHVPSSWNLSTSKSPSVSELIKYYERTGNSEALHKLYMEQGFRQTRSSVPKLHQQNSIYSSSSKDTMHDPNLYYTHLDSGDKAHANLYSRFEQAKKQSPNKRKANKREPFGSDSDTEIDFNLKRSYDSFRKTEKKNLQPTTGTAEGQEPPFISSIHRSKFTRIAISLLFLSLVVQIWRQQLLFNNGFTQKRKGGSLETRESTFFFDENEAFFPQVAAYLNFNFEKLFMSEKGLRCIDHATCGVHVPIPYKCFIKNPGFENNRQICISAFGDSEEVVIQCDPGYVIANNEYSSVLYPVLPSCVADMDTIIKVQSMIDDIIGSLSEYRGKVECSQSIFLQLDRILKSRNKQRKQSDSDSTVQQDKSEASSSLGNITDNQNEIRDYNQAETIKKLGISYNELKSLLRPRYTMNSQQFDYFLGLTINKLVSDYSQQLSIVRVEYVDSDIESSGNSRSSAQRSDGDIGGYDPDSENDGSDEVSGVYLMANIPKYPLLCRFKLLVLTAIVSHFKVAALIIAIIFLFYSIRHRMQNYYEQKAEVERLVNLTISRLESIAYENKVLLDSTVEAQIPSMQLRDLLFFNSAGAGGIDGKQQDGAESSSGLLSIIKSKLGFTKANYFDIKARQRIWQKVVQIVERNTNVRSKSTIVRGQPMRTWEWVGPFFNVHKTPHKTPRKISSTGSPSALFKTDQNNGLESAVDGLFNENTDFGTRKDT